VTTTQGGHPVREALGLDSLPVGEISRFFLPIGESGLGQPLSVPVVVARGRRPGPTLGITAAVHGNELNGIPVIHRLMRKLDVGTLRGTLVAVPVVNVLGYERRQRRFMEGRDLNHLMPGRPDGNDAEVYAHRFLHRVVRHLDFLIDLHTASSGRVNSLYVRADLTDQNTASMAYLLRPQIILHNPPSDGTLRGAAMALGIPAVTLEIGNPQRFHPEFVRSSVVGVRRVLAHVGMVPKRRVAEGPEPVLCHRSAWIYTDRGGLLTVQPGLTERVESGQLIARMTDIFGEPNRDIHAPFDGVVIGRSVDPVAQTGARVLHLGAVADPAEHPFYSRPPAS